MEKLRIEQLREQLLLEKKQLEHDLGESAIKTDSHWETKRPQFDEAGRFGEEERADEVEEYENESSVDRHLEAQLTAVTVALEKINAGTYGICEQCGSAIDDARLTANPSARTHTACAN
ncbi:MAG: TraR/DksA C4-type zinc finger protein [Candidatus Azambacteria bacterium]|nr:TraR/DksA C4-type zinc finger protein [Candidatus Azambacteria bacterium]